VIGIIAAQLAQASLAAGRVNNGIQIRAFDGFAWSATDNVRWRCFTSLGGQCPLWVKSGHSPLSAQCPLCANSGHSIPRSLLIH
jgi:hypothetical protein